MTHPTDLDAYAAGLLTPARAGAVEQHLRSCRDCAAEADAWHSTATAIRAEVAAVPSPGASLFAAIAARLTPATPVPVYRPATHRGRARPALALRLVAAQLRIVHRAVWPATALTLALGVTLVAAGPDGSAVDLLGLIAPLVGALALAALPAPDADPGHELVAASGTSARVVLLARLTVLSAWTAGLALGASILLTVLGQASDTLTVLVEGWLGPFALLSAVSVLGAVIWRPTVGVTIAVGLWGVRCLARTGLPGTWDPLMAGVDRWWTTDASVLIVAAVLTAAAVLLAPYRFVRRGPEATA